MSIPRSMTRKEFYYRRQVIRNMQKRAHPDYDPEPHLFDEYLLPEPWRKRWVEPACLVRYWGMMKTSSSYIDPSCHAPCLRRFMKWNIAGFSGA